MLISHPRARCNQLDIINDEKMLIRSMDYQIITAYTISNDTAIPKHIDRALSYLLEKIRTAEKVKTQCLMIGDFMYEEGGKGEDTKMKNQIEYAVNRRRSVLKLYIDFSNLFRILRNKSHTDPWIWRSEATIELCDIGDILARVLTEHVERKKGFSKRLWEQFIEQATDINIELQLMRLENIIRKSKLYLLSRKNHSL